MAAQNLYLDSDTGATDFGYAFTTLLGPSVPTGSHIRGLVGNPDLVHGAFQSGPSARERAIASSN